MMTSKEQLGNRAASVPGRAAAARDAIPMAVSRNGVDPSAAMRKW